MGPPPGEAPDETRLDMNPLIDVALVLLIFFILTTTYESLRRAIDLPPGGRVEIVAGSRPVKWVRLDDSPFTDRLVTKFRLPVTGWRGRAGAEDDGGDVPLA